MRFCVAALALLLVPAALAQGTQTFRDADTGLHVTLPASFVTSDRVDMPQGVETPEAMHWAFADEATGILLTVEIHTTFGPLQRFIWRRGWDDVFTDRFVLADLDVADLSVPATAVYEATPVLAPNPVVAERQREDPRHAVLAYGCDGARCFRLVAEASTDVEQAVLGAMLYGVRFEG
ncbi:MAG: hypothetical protein AAF089_18855 [Bacteroidota bacterium]